MQVIQTVSRATVYMNYIMFGSLHKKHEIFFMIPLREKVIFILYLLLSSIPCLFILFFLPFVQMLSVLNVEILLRNIFRFYLHR